MTEENLSRLALGYIHLSLHHKAGLRFDFNLRFESQKCATLSIQIW